MMEKSFVLSDSFLCNEISNFTLEMTQQCNFRCSYCCYSGEYSGMRPHSSKHMDEKTMKHTIEFIKNHAHPKNEINISFFGGESLLQLKRIINVVEALTFVFGNRIYFDVSTNGLLLNLETIDLLLNYNIGISVSLDGCKTVHDRNRKTVTGKSTFDAIVSNLLCFKKKYPDEYKKRIRLLVTVGTLKDIELMNDGYETFKNLLGDKPVFVSHIYPNFEKNKLYEENNEFKRKFLDIAIEHKRQGIDDFYTLLLDDLTKKANKKFSSDENCRTILIKTCLDNIYSMFIDSFGLLFPCEKFDIKHSIGDVKTGIDKELLKKWSGLYVLRRSILCSNCHIVEYCTRCLADLKMSVSEQKQMCRTYIENVELALIYNKKLQDNA